MQAEYWALIIVGAMIGILVLFYFFAQVVGIGKSRKRPGMSVTKKENFFTKFYKNLGGKIKRPKITLGLIVLLIIIILVAFGVGYTVYRNTDIARHMTFSFNSSASLSNYWTIESGNWRVENGCLIGSGKLKLKNPNALAGWIRVEVVPPNIGDPCGSKTLDGMTIQIGDILYPYKISSVPPDKRISQGKYHVGGMFYKAEIEDNIHILATRSSQLIDTGKEGPYPIGIDRYNWFEFWQPKLEMYICYWDEPMCPRVLALSNSRNDIATEGGLTIIAKKEIIIKEAKAFY